MLFKRAATLCVCIWIITSTIRAAPSITLIGQDPRGFSLLSVAVSSHGEIYVLEPILGIARVNPADGILTTVAGGGTDRPDGIPAPNAALPVPHRILSDPA